MTADLHLGVVTPVRGVDDAGRQPQHPLLDLAEGIEIDRASVWSCSVTG